MNDSKLMYSKIYLVLFTSCTIRSSWGHAWRPLVQNYGIEVRQITQPPPWISLLLFSQFQAPMRQVKRVGFSSIMLQWLQCVRRSHGLLKLFHSQERSIQMSKYWNNKNKLNVQYLSCSFGSSHTEHNPTQVVSSWKTREKRIITKSA